MLGLLGAFVTAFAISFLFVPVIIKYSLQRNLVDIPGKRKIHKKITPSLGGIAIFFGFFLSVLIWTDQPDWVNLKYLLLSLFVTFILGVRDDLVALPVLVKLIGQVLASSMVIVMFGLRIPSLYGLFGIHELPVVISYVLTFITFIVITNAFNLIDGLDGLAGTIACIAFLFFGCWFALVDEVTLAVFCFALLGAILAFLRFNWEPSHIFMGDTGALVIGMMLTIVTITFLNLNNTLPKSAFTFNASIATGACVIIIPLVDTLRIVILRLYKKQSPFSPDKNHIHHTLLRLGLKHSQTTLLLGGVQIGFIVIAISCQSLGDNIVLPLVIVLATALSITLDRLIIGKLRE